MVSNKKTVEKNIAHRTYIVDEVESNRIGKAIQRHYGNDFSVFDWVYYNAEGSIWQAMKQVAKKYGRKLDTNLIAANTEEIRELAFKIQKEK
jgi:hypothetical protein